MAAPAPTKSQKEIPLQFPVEVPSPKAMAIGTAVVAVVKSPVAVLLSPL